MEPAPGTHARVLWFREIGMEDARNVGGKAASLGELHRSLGADEIRVPDGYVTTAAAYEEFLTTPVPRDTWVGIESHEIPFVHADAARTSSLGAALDVLLTEADPGDAVDLHARAGLARAFCMAAPIPPGLRRDIEASYGRLCELYGREVDTAVRSSATREDSEEASFAGQYESFLNVRGAEAIVDAWKRCAASAFTERVISYQLRNSMDPLGGAVCVVVMKMVRSDLATSGVMFTIDPDSGNANVIHISSAYGLGEAVVQGAVSPDTFLVWKEGLHRDRAALVHRHLGAKDRKMIYSTQGGTSTESVDVAAAHRRRWSLRRGEVLELARMGLAIEKHYGRPMDIEWAKDGYSGELYIVQARPETVHRPATGGVLEKYVMDEDLVRRLREDGSLLAEGQGIGTRIGSGKVRYYASYEEVIRRKRHLREILAAGQDLDDLPAEERVFDHGDVLVTEMTTPDWEPLMKEASLIVTAKGGRTSHAAIVAREFGVPAIVGCGDATRSIEPLTEVTGTCAEGETAYLFRGIHPFEVRRVELDARAELRTKVKLNVGFPSKALHDAMLPSDGVGLARIEFILTAEVGIHPLALLHFQELRAYVEGGDMADALLPFEDAIRREPREEIGKILGAVERRTASYADKRQFFVDRVRDGVALICAAFHPRPVLVRLSDLKSNEYRDLLGGRLFEPAEENPMIAWRGASRYVDPRFAPAFEMETEALRFVRQEMGLDNLQLMVPFCRTPEEGHAVTEALDRRGLSPQAGVPLFLMVELPSNVIEAERFIQEMHLAGGSIGTNDLVQTVYALSRDDLVGYPHTVDARAPAVKVMIREAVRRFRERDLEIGICGQAPSDHPDEVPAFLVECGITSISVTPDSLVRVREAVAAAEEAASLGGPTNGHAVARSAPAAPRALRLSPPVPSGTETGNAL